MVISATGVDKAYDGTTAATVTLSDNGLSGDDLSLAYTTAAFADQNAGSAKPVSVSGITLGGDRRGQLHLRHDCQHDGQHHALPITVSATANSKVYDGTVTAAALPTITAGSLVTGDSASLSETYDTAIAGSAKTLTPAAVITDGNGGNNYAVTLATAAGVITPAPLTITANSKSRVYGATNPLLTASYSGFVAGEDATVLSAAPSMSTTADSSSPEGAYPITASAAAAANYAISYADGTLNVIALPQMAGIVAVDGQVILTFPTTLGQTYQVVSASSLTSPVWTAAGDPITGTGSSVSVTNSVAGPQSFFRLQLNP